MDTLFRGRRGCLRETSWRTRTGLEGLDISSGLKTAQNPLGGASRSVAGQKVMNKGLKCISLLVRHEVRQLNVYILDIFTFAMKPFPSLLVCLLIKLDENYLTDFD